MYNQIKLSDETYSRIFCLERKQKPQERSKNKNKTDKNRQLFSNLSVPYEKDTAIIQGGQEVCQTETQEIHNLKLHLVYSQFII